MQQMGWMAVASVTSWVLASGGVAAEPKPERERTLVMEWSIGWSGTDVGNSGWNLREAGWPGFIRDQVEPAIAWCEASGVRPIVLIHHPFGQFGEPMHLDGFDLAESEGADWLTKDFAADEAWKSVTSRVPCYVYVGGVDLTPRLKELSTAERCALTCRNLQPMADAGFRGVFIDAAENAIREPYQGVSAEQSAEKSVDLLTIAIADDMFPERTGVEAAPRAFPPFKHLWDRPVIAQDSLWRHRFGGVKSAAQIKRIGYGGRHGSYKALGYDRSVLTGDVWRTIPFTSPPEKTVEIARLISKEGDVACVGPMPLMQAGVKASALFP